MNKYTVFGWCGLGAGYLSIQDGKRHWGKKAQLFGKEEIDSVLAAIGPEWNWKCYCIHGGALYKKHVSMEAYVG